MTGCGPMYSKTVVCKPGLEAMYCCDQKQFHLLEPNHIYKHNTPLTKKKTEEGYALFAPWKPGDTLDGILTCDVDATCWDDKPLPQWICTRVNDPFPGTLLCWPAGTTDHDVEVARCKIGCCINIAPSRKHCDSTCDDGTDVDQEAEEQLKMPASR